MSIQSLPGDIQWKRESAAAAFIASITDAFCEKDPQIRSLQTRLLTETGTRLSDWLATIALPKSYEAQCLSVGYQKRGEHLLQHDGGLFPAIVTNQINWAMYFKVDSVDDFLKAHCVNDHNKPNTKDAVAAPVPMNAIRFAKVDSQSSNVDFFVVEQNGVPCGEYLTGLANVGGLANLDQTQIEKYRKLFRDRQRDFDDTAKGFDHAETLIRQAIVELGKPRACDLFFAVEREFWQNRNRAAQIQKQRQDKLGLGWANHDHHTYRSSREFFARMIGLFELFGFVCRERFYAGKEAGWGAQVLEDSRTGVIIFADVDLSPDEVTSDFSHQQLPSRKELGTVGLWCKLHGEAFLQAGMHHLECQFDFMHAREQLTPLGIDSMKPFTNFEFLKQSFTKGEVWKVSENRLAMLLQAGQITEQQADNFRKNGAIGSHLEILQRDDGYKGFNQTGISDIILKTDPRKQTH